ncbi:DMT family transporter [Oceanobacter mangrovi]|uniref:DMT family transporter n=1 Tax=Oceanobacter mangrovi TaxID=2862510 RepID=UPI001C8EA4B7|nr:DMT family transporter [Oceanobacter mangrovi]
MPLGLITTLVLIAFAANSLLCRWALREYQFDPALFTLVRLWSGALMLSLLLQLSRRRLIATPRAASAFWQQRRNWLLALTLFVYAAGFSAAYVQLDTGLGAFILFTTVQLSLQGVSLIRGVIYTPMQIVGILLAMAGLAGLLLPGSGSAELLPVLLMILAGLGWSGFVLLGQGSSAPLKDVQTAFVLAAVLVLSLIPLVQWQQPMHWQAWGLALLSGGVASGIGYFGWYQVLPRLGLQLAAQLQLLVPALAVVMGAIVLQETLSLAMIGAMAMIVVGVFVVLRFKKAV